MADAAGERPAFAVSRFSVHHGTDVPSERSARIRLDVFINDRRPRMAGAHESAHALHRKLQVRGEIVPMGRADSAGQRLSPEAPDARLSSDGGQDPGATPSRTRRSAPGQLPC